MRRPDLRYINSSYASNLSIRDNVKSRTQERQAATVNVNAFFGFPEHSRRRAPRRRGIAALGGLHAQWNVHLSTRSALG